MPYKRNKNFKAFLKKKIPEKREKITLLCIQDYVEQKNNFFLENIYLRLKFDLSLKKKTEKKFFLRGAISKLL